MQIEWALLLNQCSRALCDHYGRLAGLHDGIMLRFHQMASIYRYDFPISPGALDRLGFAGWLFVLNDR